MGCSANGRRKRIRRRNNTSYYLVVIMAILWYQASSSYLQNSAPESCKFRVQCGSRQRIWHNWCTYRRLLFSTFVKTNWNVSTNLLEPVILNSIKMRSTVSQVTTCGLTEAEMAKLANTILRFVVATELQTEQKGRYEFVTFWSWTAAIWGPTQHNCITL